MRLIAWTTKVALGSALTVALCATTAAAQDEDWPLLDLTLYGGAIVSTGDDRRPDALGLSGGVAAIIRLNDLFGLGLTIEHDVFGWDHPLYGPGWQATLEGSAEHDLALLTARLYFLELGPADLFAQLGLGYGDVTYEPDSEDCSINDGFAAQLALGSEFRVTRSLGVHASLAAWPYGWGLGCDEGGALGDDMPDPPYLGMVVAARAGITTVWR